MTVIGIGASYHINKVVSAAEKASTEENSIIIYAPEGSTINRGSRFGLRLAADPEEEMIDALMQGEIDAAVRGTLPSSTTLRYLKKAAGVDHLERIALLETADGRQFLLTPVGVDEGWSISDKMRLIKSAGRLADQIGISRSIGILSGGRLGDIGRNPDVDRSLADAELLARLTGGVHAEILIEDAVGRYGIVIAPDGISGNLIFRTLVLLGSGSSHGAPVVNIDVPFVDTSRATDYYDNAIQLASLLSRQK